MGQFFLLLLTAIYFIRPSEWLPGLAGMPLFQIVILTALVLCFGAWTSQLSERSLRTSPISACVCLLLGISFVSEVLNLGTVTSTTQFAKSVLLYLLVTGLIDTHERLLRFLQGFACVLFLLGLLVLLNHHGILAVGSDSSPIGGVWEDRGGQRLGAIGGLTFDPNDTAVLTMLGAILSLHFAAVARPLFLRPVWLGMACCNIYVLQLTDSRGGFLSLVVGLGAYIWLRWGRKGLLWGACLLPLVAAKIATARMAGLGSAFLEDTGQSRLQFWTSALVLAKSNPLLGAGPGSFSTIVGRASHNSFLQAFAELGFFGGTLFLGAFGYGAWQLYSIRRSLATQPGTSEPSNQAQVAMMLALLSGYAVAILALNHLFGMATYIVLAAATVCIRNLGDEETTPFSSLFAKFCGLSVLFLIASKLAVVLLVRW